MKQKILRLCSIAIRIKKGPQKGKNLLRHQAQGESYYRKYNVEKAIEQFNFALKAKDGNFYEQSIVEARLKELKRQQDNEKLADKRLS